jgi:hypothetical protein
MRWTEAFPAGGEEERWWWLFVVIDDVSVSLSARALAEDFLHVQLRLAVMGVGTRCDGMEMAAFP